MDNAATVIIAVLVIIPAIYFLVKSIGQEAVEGKCASCYSKKSCSDRHCSGSTKDS